MTVPQPIAPSWASVPGRVLEFNVHGRASMRVMATAPTASQLREMFRPFLTSGLVGADLHVEAEPELMAGASVAEHDYRHTERALLMCRSKVQVSFEDDGIHLRGTRELLTAVLPLLDWILAGRDVAMIHAATVDWRGNGFALPAWGGVGKTSTIAKLVRRPGVAFMGDDWAFASAAGELLGYAKPMFIKPHHRPIYPHLFEQRRKPLVPKALSRPVGEVTTLVHPLVTQYPRLASLSRRWSPEHLTITPQEALPGTPISMSAPLAAVMFVERWEGDGPRLEDVSRPWMVTRLVGNFHAELARPSRDLITALGATNLVPLEELFARKAEVLDRALDGRPTLWLRVPVAYSADEASDSIVEVVEKLAADLGIG